MDDLELYDVQTEREILKALLFNKNFISSAIMFHRIIVEHFADLFHRDSFKVISEYYKKFGIAPSKKHFKRLIAKRMTRSKNFSTPEAQKKIWIKSADRLFIEPTKSELDRLNANVSNLDEMRKARLLQETIIKSQQQFENGEYEKAFSLFSKSRIKSTIVEQAITEGDIVSDFQHHVMLIKKKRSGEFKPIKIRIRGAINDHDGGDEMESLKKIVSIDDLIGGGLYKGELTLLIGENNLGKSFFLMELSYNVAKLENTNVAFMTIEMNKDKQQMRLYSRLTGIPYNKFRTGDLTHKDSILWKQKINEWKWKQEHNEIGIIEVVSFDQGATVLDVENKLNDIENKHGKQFDVLVIDYLNDMKPIGVYKSDKDWNAQGEISWSLAQLAKYYHNHEGIVVVTANQRKDTGKNTSAVNWHDAALSKLPTQHASVGIGIFQTNIDREVKRIRWSIWKNRDGEKGGTFLTYPRFDIARISSMKRLNEFYGL